MRAAALILGVIAGLVASVVLARNGIEPATYPADPWIIRLALQALSLLAVLAAGLVIGTPLVGAILLVLAALGWAGAAWFLQGTLFAVVAPPALLLIAAALGLVAHFRRPAAVEALPPLDVDLSPAPAEEPMTAGLMFEAEPEARTEPVPELEPLPGSFEGEDMRATPDQRWRPGKRRPPPPRQEPVFREPEMEEYEEPESGFSRFARGFSGILSFGLYAALAGAAVLIYFNLRTDVSDPTSARVAEVAPVSSSSSSSSSVEPAAPSSSTSAPMLAVPSTAPSEASASNPLSPVLTGDLAADPGPNLPLRDVSPSTIFGGPEDAASSASFEAASSSLDPSAIAASTASSSSEAPVQLEPENLLAAAAPDSSSSEAPSSAEPSPLPEGMVMPFTMPAQMAAARAQPSPGPTTVAASPAERDTTGL